MLRRLDCADECTCQKSSPLAMEAAERRSTPLIRYNFGFLHLPHVRSFLRLSTCDRFMGCSSCGCRSDTVQKAIVVSQEETSLEPELENHLPSPPLLLHTAVAQSACRGSSRIETSALHSACHSAALMLSVARHEIASRFLGGESSTRTKAGSTLIIS